MGFLRLLLASLFVSIVMGSALGASDARAVQPDEVLSDPALEGRARALSAGLRCLVCQNQSIDDSDAPLARDLRVLVRERLKAGDSDDEIITFVVSRYGEFVLLKPRFIPETWLLWLATPLLLIAAVIGIFLYFRRRTARPVPSAALTKKEEERLLQLAGSDAREER